MLLSNRTNAFSVGGMPCMEGVNFWVILFNFLDAMMIVTVGSVILYWVARAAVKAELKRYLSINAGKEKHMSDSDVEDQNLKS